MERQPAEISPRLFPVFPSTRTPRMGTDPLFIVDGSAVSSIEWINPHDVKSIDVLKDAAATSIYGSRGANGVIIINLK